MVNYLFQQEAVKSKVIDIPFSFKSGSVSVVDSNSASAWRNKVLTVLMTDTGSRVWYDRYGASLSDLLFEPNSDAGAFIQEAVAEALTRWIPEVSLENVLYTYDGNTGTLTVTVIYRPPNGTEDRVTLRQQSITSSGDSLQVVWNG